MLSLAEALLVVTIGACVHLAALRIWLGARDQGPSRWAAGWALGAVAFSGTRLLQLTTHDPEFAVMAARLQLAASPLLLWTLYRLIGGVTEHQPRPGELRAVGTVALASAALAAFTPWCVSSETFIAVDLTGDPYFDVRVGPGIWLPGTLSLVAIVWCLGRVARTRLLSHEERRSFLTALSLYAAMGVSSLLPALGLMKGEGVFEYGPLVIAIGISRLLALRQRRLEDGLELQVASRARARQESEARLRRVIEHAPIGFLVVDMRGQLDFANRAMLAMAGSSSEQFERAFNVAELESSQRSGFSEMLARSLASGEALSGEFEFDSWWGRHLHTRTTVSPHRDAAGQLGGALVMVEDITEQRALEKRIQRAQRLEAVGQLAAGIAHEINNPMAYVRSNLSVLGAELAALEKVLPREGSALAGARAQILALEERRAAALASVQRTVSIVRDLREFSHAGGGEREAVDANAQLEHAARLAGARADGLREVALEFGEIPPVAIDASQLRQVLLNLLTHAQQATGPQGRVRASTALGAGCVLISVNDDGPPILPEERGRLFEPFALSRGAGEPTLGLYVSQQIVREYDGKIDVLSSDTHGTTFVVRLPIAHAESATSDESAARA